MAENEPLAPKPAAYVSPEWKDELRRFDNVVAYAFPLYGDKSVALYGPGADPAIATLTAARDRALAALDAMRAERDARDTINAALMDCQYVAGAQAGWNCAQADDPNAEFQKLVASRDGRIAALKEARAALRALAAQEKPQGIPPEKEG